MSWTMWDAPSDRDYQEQMPDPLGDERDEDPGMPLPEDGRMEIEMTIKRAWEVIRSTDNIGDCTSVEQALIDIVKNLDRRIAELERMLEHCI